jgi:hypothetical protein
MLINVMSAIECYELCILSRFIRWSLKMARLLLWRNLAHITLLLGMSVSTRGRDTISCKFTVTLYFAGFTYGYESVASGGLWNVIHEIRKSLPGKQTSPLTRAIWHTSDFYSYVIPACRMQAYQTSTWKHATMDRDVTDWRWAKRHTNERVNKLLL